MQLWNAEGQKFESYKQIRCRVCAREMKASENKFYADGAEANTCYDCYKIYDKEKEANQIESEVTNR